MSLRDEQSFAHVANQLQFVPVKAGSVIFVWAFSHHVLTGVRHLLAFLLATFALDPVQNYAQRRGWVDRPGIKIALATFFAALRYPPARST